MAFCSGSSASRGRHRGEALNRKRGKRREGVLLPERIGKLLMRVQTDSPGAVFEFTPEYSLFRSYAGGSTMCDRVIHAF